MNPRLGPALMTAGGATLLPAAVLYLMVLPDPFVRGLMAVVFVLGGAAVATGYVLREVSNTPRPPQPPHP